MKRALLILLAVLYLGVSSGATMQFHYCMGKLSDWNLSSEKSSHCKKCGMKKGSSHNCCKTSQKQLKLDRSHKVSSLSVDFNVPFIDLPVLSLSFRSTGPLAEKVVRLPFSKAPPGWRTVPVFIRNCTYRI